jgi:hypothetical protein
LKISDFLKEFYRLKFGQALSREAQQLDELFMLMLFLDYFGIPNPYKLHLVEVIPFIIEDFHRWHRRMGLRSSPLEWIRCC